MCYNIIKIRKGESLEESKRYLVDVSNQIDFEPRFETLEEAEEYYKKSIGGDN